MSSADVVSPAPPPPGCVQQARRRKSGRFCSLEEKLAAVTRLDHGETVNALAAELGVGVKTVLGWRKNISPTTAQFTGGRHATQRKTNRTADFAEMEDQLFAWILQRRADGKSSPAQPAICRQAVRIYSELAGGPAEFKASSGWYARFIRRFDVREKSAPPEHLPPGHRDPEAPPVKSTPPAAAEQPPTAPSSSTTSSSKIDLKLFDHEDMYNFHEAGLLYRCLPMLTSTSSRGERGPRGAKDRLTLGVCANATASHKIPLLVVGKSAKPRGCASAEEVDDLPVHYVAGRNKAFTTRRVFADWFEGIFVPSVEEKQIREGRARPVLLLVDDAPSHAVLREGSVYKERFFVSLVPPNAASPMLPMDLGVIALLKNIYRADLVDSLLLSRQHVLDFYKTITVKDACFMVATAWEELSEEKIRQAWREVFDRKDGLVY